MKPDLESLYSELDLQPNCSLEEFRRAYHRRIGELHPDRPRAEPPSAEARSELRELVWMYATVNRFHRRYGRMPGANGRDSGKPVSHSRTETRLTVSDIGSGESPGGGTLILLLLFIALLILGAYLNWLTSTPKKSAHVPLPTPAAIASVLDRSARTTPEHHDFDRLQQDQQI